MRKIQDIFTTASHRFNQYYTIPQPLARHFYLNEKDFSLALTWANDAREINYSKNTIRQVHKIHLKLKAKKD